MAEATVLYEVPMNHIEFDGYHNQLEGYYVLQLMSDGSTRWRDYVERTGTRGL